MALADYGYDTSVNGGVISDTHVLSLKTETTRKGYAISASDAANGPWQRIVQCVLCAMMVTAGTVLMGAASVLVTPGSIGLWLLPAIGVYVFVTGVIWLARLSRRQIALHVDHGARAFHLVRRSLLGTERNRQTIRFEEIVKISLVDGLRATDMKARRMNWDMARIDVTWRQSKVTEILAGDAAELETLVARLRREVGMA